MTQDVHYEILKCIKDFEENYEKSGPLQKIKYTLQSFWIGLILRFPIIIPTILGGVIGIIIIVIVDAFGPIELKKWEVLIAGIIVFPSVWTMMNRNINFIHFVQQYIKEEEKNKKNANK